MLKEPAEPENTQRGREEEREQESRTKRRERKQKGTGKKRGTEKGVKMIMHKQKCIKWVSLGGQLAS